MARVSVIIAARNAAITLPGTLASVAAQTYGDWEVYLVDDGSSDDTAAVAAQFSGALRLFRNDSSKGPSAARNRAAADARGELLAMLDADDAWRPKYLERLVAAYDEGRSRGRAVGLLASDAAISDGGAVYEDTYFARVGYDPPLTLEKLLFNNVLSSMAVCPRDVFFEAGGYDESIRHGEDYDLWLRILELGYEVVVEDDVLASYRVRPEAASADTVRLSEGAARVYELALRRGGLNARQRRIARRQRRLQRVVATRARLATTSRRRLSARIRAIPLAAFVALEHPERWTSWLRGGIRVVGPSRHG